jgi:rfaE bifunctional protein kinase chain/domain
MTSIELKSLLARFQELSILVVGDFFLDRYLIIDPGLAEISLETGLEARQVIEIRNSPGAAGTVASNLSALGVGQIHALGVIGTDGHGHDLKAGLEKTRVIISGLIEVDGRFTPTYTKPISSRSGQEMERLDVKNRDILPRELEDRIISNLERALSHVDGVIILDQVQEENCGVITNRVRDSLVVLASENPTIFFFADSRTRIGEFPQVITKPNAEEASRIEFPNLEHPPDRSHLMKCIRSFSIRTGRPVYITLGEDGILCDDLESVHHIPGISMPDPIDIVGAGDSASAAIVSALCAGASYVDAGMMGVLASSITIQQLGTTGTAEPGQILDRFDELRSER